MSQPKPKKKVGRPTLYTAKLGQELCNRLAEGRSLKRVCEQEDMPAKATVFRWMGDHQEFRDKYARACEERTEAQNELLLELGDEAISLAQEVSDKASSAVVQAVKLKADNLKWVMSKQKPKKYGDKIDHTSGGEKINPIPIFGGASKNGNLSTDDSNKQDISTEEKN